MRTHFHIRRLSVLITVILFLLAPVPPLQAAPQASVKLSHTLGANQRVLDFRVSPSGERIAYRVARTLPPAQDNPPPPPADLFSVPASGGAEVQLNPPAAIDSETIESYQFSPDGQQIIYLRTTTDATLGNVFELFSVAADGSTGPVSVSGPIPIGPRATRDFTFTVRQASIRPLLGDGSVRSVNYSVHNRSVPERITSITDGTSNTFFFGEQVNNLLQTPADGSVRQLNPTLTSGGVVYDFEITPDGTRSIYRADQNLDGTIELFSVPADGSDAGFRISGPMVVGGDVQSFKVNATSTRAAYLADQTTDGVAELYSARTNGGAVAKLNAPLPLGGAVADYQFSPDGNLVVYQANQLAPNKFDLFAVASSGSAATLVSGGAFGGSVRKFLIGPGGSQVYYVDNSGPGGSLRLSSHLLALGATGGSHFLGPTVANLPVPDVKVSADGTHLVLLADNGNDGVYELASIALPSEQLVSSQLNAPLALGGNIRAFQISPDGQRVVYAADQNTAGVVELFTTPIEGGPVDRVNIPLVAGGAVGSGPQDFQFSPDSRTVYYLADAVTAGVTELFAAADAPTVAFAQAGYVTAEDGTLGTQFTVQRSGILNVPSSVRVELTGKPDGGTATGGASLAVAGVDFVDNARDVSFAAGEITRTVPVPIKNDGVPEAPETFSMSLFEPTQAITGPPAASQVIILDSANSPLLQDQVLTLPENSANGTVVPAAQAAELDATAVVTYAILGGNTGNAFGINSSGALFVNNSAALNYETTPVFALVVEARADNGSFDVATWTIQLADQNEAPVFATQTRTIAENSANGTSVGTRLTAIDPEGGPITFTMAAGVFAITTDGQLFVKDNTKLDFETQKQFNLKVVASDSKGLSTAAAVVVNVLDVAEGDPTFPTIAALSPGSVVAGSAGFTLIVSGKNLTADAVVQWNGAERKTALSKGVLLAAISARDVAVLGTVKVTVFDRLTSKTSDAVAFAVTKGVVGIAELTTEPPGAAQGPIGDRTVFNLSWTHTSQPWRAMDEMDLRLINGDAIPLWVRYQETRDENGNDISTIVLLNADGTPAGKGRFGEAKVLENDTVQLNLAEASFQGSGPTGSNIRVRIPVVFKHAAVQVEPYAIEMYGVDDLGGKQGPNLMGTWRITEPGLYIPFVDR